MSGTLQARPWVAPAENVLFSDGPDKAPSPRRLRGIALAFMNVRAALSVWRVASSLRARCIATDASAWSRTSGDKRKCQSAAFNGNADRRQVRRPQASNIHER